MKRVFTSIVIKSIHFYSHKGVRVLVLLNLTENLQTLLGTACCEEYQGGHNSYRLVPYGIPTSIFGNHTVVSKFR